MNLTDFFLVAAAYFLGAAPFSVWISRAFGLGDPRDFGSGNPGATNVARRNKTAAFLTLLADGGKGFLPAFFAADVGLAAAAGLAAVGGHIFSIFLRMRGGKGVATALGVFCAWHWAAGIAALVAWGMLFLLFRISSVSSIFAMIAAAAMLIFFADLQLALAGTTMAALVIFRHRRNIADLFCGRERGFGEKNSGKRRSFVVRMLIASLALAGVLTALGFAHDYSVTRRQIDLIRQGDEIAAARPWIATFFFLNEAGDGMKYLLTGDEKYMRHYPTAAYLWEKKLERAQRNQWRFWERLAIRYRNGEGVAQDNRLALQWLRRTKDAAPAAERARIAAVIREWETADSPQDS